MQVDTLQQEKFEIQTHADRLDAQRCQETSELQQKLVEAEERDRDAACAVAAATQPLLRQVRSGGKEVSYSTSSSVNHSISSAITAAAAFWEQRS